MSQRRNRTRNKPRNLEAVETEAQNGPIPTPGIEKLFITPGENVDLSTAEIADMVAASKELTVLLIMALGDAGAAMQSIYNGLDMLVALTGQLAERLEPSDSPS